MLLCTVVNTDENTIKNVAFKFIDERNLMQALVRTIEGVDSWFVAAEKQTKCCHLENRKDVKSKLTRP